VNVIRYSAFLDNDLMQTRIWIPASHAEGTTWVYAKHANIFFWQQTASCGFLASTWYEGTQHNADIHGSIEK
jgi:hypothetical protein